MFTFDTADQKEVRRLRTALFNGRVVSVRSEGSTITGHVRSVHESRSSVSARWTITIVQDQPKTKPHIPRPAPRVHTFEDLY